MKKRILQVLSLLLVLNTLIACADPAGSGGTTMGTDTSATTGAATVDDRWYDIQTEYRISTETGLLHSIDIENWHNDALNDDIYVVTGKREYRLSQAPEIKQTATGQFEYCFEDAVFRLTYQEMEDTHFITRTLETVFYEKTTLLKIGFTMGSYQESFLYESYTNASAAVFVRNSGYGYCMGFANPYFKRNGNAVEFEPSMILYAYEAFACEPSFFGVYELSGEMISPEVAKTQMEDEGYYLTRYRNPSEGILLDYAEIKAMNEFTAAYFKADEQTFKFMSYNFFSNLPQRPTTEAEVEAYKRHIDAFSLLGGDTILLNPLAEIALPNEDYTSYWELIPEGSYAEEIVNYAREKGLDIGFYQGTACNEPWSNSTLQNYADEAAWKKVNYNGEVSCENCIAEDSFADWFIQVQINTIQKYDLSVWTWDPGPGNGFFCYNEEHKHLPGKGEYLGFRNAMRTMQQIKEACPDIYFVCFHGLKEYGLWGFQYADQHEAYWENEVYVMSPVFEDMSPDRATADGIRFQSTWNYYFRFLPASMNQGLSHRMQQACFLEFDRKLSQDSLVDVVGYRYALMSILAAGGSVTMPIVPADPKSIDGYVEFYQEWTAWAKENFKYSAHTVPFLAQAGCGVEGYAKLIDNEGYIFIVNPFATPMEYSFALSDRLGYTNDGSKKNITMIYPYSEDRGQAGYGDTLSGIIPGYEVLVFKVSSETPEIDKDQSLSPTLDRYLENTYVSDNAVSATFFAGDEMLKLLADGDKYVTGATLATMKDYGNATGRVNDCYTRPDRLWLWIYTEEALDVSKLKLTVNGQQIAPRVEVNNHLNFSVVTGLYCDITGAMIAGQENQIQVEYDGIAAMEPVIYLHYLRPQNEAFPETAVSREIAVQQAPVLDESVQVVSAALNIDNIMYQERNNILVVELNIPAEEVLGVYASVPISIGDTDDKLKCDMALEYRNGKWQITFYGGRRQELIVDPYEIRIWVVTKSHTESKAYALRFTWDMVS